MELKEQYEDILLLGKELSLYILETLLKEEKKILSLFDKVRLDKVHHNCCTDTRHSICVYFSCKGNFDV